MNRHARPLKPGALAVVTWVDSAKLADAWTDPADAAATALSTAESVGWVLALHSDRVVLAASRIDRESRASARHGEVTAVPLACVTGVRVLESAKD